MKNNHGPRWFIWTIVFLVVVGASLLAYISSSNAREDVNAADSAWLVHHSTYNR